MNLSKKHQLKNYVRIFVLLFGVSVLLWNCEKEEEVVLLEQAINAKPTIETISFEEAIEEKPFTELNNSYNLKLHENNDKYKGSILKTLDTLGITIETGTIKKIVSTDYISYTMQIVEPKNTSNSFYNLVIQEHNDVQEIFTVKYRPDTNATLSSTASFIGDVDIRSGMDPKQLWGDNDGGSGGGGSGDDHQNNPDYIEECNFIEVMIPHSCGCNPRHMPGQDCTCPYGRPYYTVESKTECVWVYTGDDASNDTDNNTGGGGNNGDSSNNDNSDDTEGQVITTPVNEDGDQIIITPDLSLDYPCQSEIIESTFLKTAPLSKLILDVFDGESGGYNLVFDEDPNLKGTQVQGATQPSSVDSEWHLGKLDIIIGLNPDLLNNGTDLAIASIVVHESVHALLIYALETNKITIENSSATHGLALFQLVQKFLRMNIRAKEFGEIQQVDAEKVDKLMHKYMTKLIEDIATSISEFGNSKGYNLPFSYYKKLAAVGLEKKHRI